MRKLFLAFIITLFTFSFFVSHADARRFGGGRSFGISRSASSFSRANNVGYNSAAPSNGTNKWLGPLTAFAAGGLLASLFSGHGLGSGILPILMAVSVIVMLFRFFGRGANSNMRFQANQPNAASQFASFTNQAPFAASANINFDEADFLRQAKSAFFRLQAAYDSKNLSDLREFTAPAVFAEIQLQLQERGDAPNQTDVLNVDAKLLDVADENQATIASVLFSAQMREEREAAFTTVKEIWHFSKNGVSPNWVVAGIQQQ